MIEVDDIGAEGHAMCDSCFACTSSLGLQGAICPEAWTLPKQANRALLQ